MDKSLIKLTKIANELDEVRLIKVSDYIDSIIEKIVRKSKLSESQIPAKQPQIQKEGDPPFIEEKEFAQDVKKEKKPKDKRKIVFDNQK